MGMVYQLLTSGVFPDHNIYFLVEWGDQYKMLPLWIERRELVCYIHQSCDELKELMHIGIQYSLLTYKVLKKYNLWMICFQVACGHGLCDI